MSISFIVVLAFAGVLLFVLGWMVGVHTGKSRDTDDENDCFSEAIKLWRDANAKIDEMTRRNVVELGSVRERLTDFNRSISDSHVVESIGELTEQIHVLGKEVHGLRMQSETNTDAAPEHRLADSLTVSPMADSHDRGIRDLDNSACSFDDFVSEVMKKVELETPLTSLLDFVYDELRAFVPCQRMGYAEIDYEADRVSAVWHRSEQPVRLKAGYSAALSKSSLQFVAGENRPRMLLNLHDYLLRHPNSHSTRLLVEEGFGSSLTFPVAANETVVGFLFLTSVEVDGFDDDGITRVREVVKEINRAALFAQEVSLV